MPATRLGTFRWPLGGKYFLLAGFLVQAISTAYPQATPPSDLWEGIDEELAEQRLAEIVEQSIRQGLNNPNLSAVWREHSQEIRSYGGIAVRSLTRLLESQDGTRRRAAIRLLDRIGGMLTAPGLIHAVRHESDPELRLEALQRVVALNGYLRVSLLLDQVIEKEEGRDATENDEGVNALEYAQEAIRERGEIDYWEGELGGDLRQAVTPPAPIPEGLGQGFVQSRIRAIIAEVVASGTSVLRTPQGKVGLAYSRAHPTNEHQREVFGFGQSAIPALAEYAWSGSGFEWYAASRLLANLGGAELLAPLSKVVLEHTNSSRRYIALTVIVQGTSYLPISRLLQDVASEEESPSARFARQVLQATRPSQTG